MCTSPTWKSKNSFGKLHCNYHAERVTFSSAQDICEDARGPNGELLGYVQGQPGAVVESKAGPCAFGVSNVIPHFRWWASVGCDVKVKIATKTGHVAIVHDPQPDQSGVAIVEPLVDEHTLNFFKVKWTNEEWLEKCDDICTTYEDEQKNEFCICNTVVTESQVYSSKDDINSIDDIMSKLHIGAADPDSFDAETYAVIDCSIPGVTVYSTTGDCNALTIDTVFGLEWKSKKYFLKNMKSMVTVRGSDVSFRNPVHFINFADPNAFAAHHETDAVLDSLFYHPSHPPFMAIR